MKIFHIIPTLATAGAETFVVALANAQAASGEHEVTLLTTSPPSPDMFLAERISPNVRLMSLNKRPGADPTLPFQLLRTLRRECPDVVNTHLRSIYYSFPAQILLRIPSFHTIHNMADKETGKSYRHLLRLLVNRFQFTPVAISPTVLDSVHRLYGRNHRLMIENGIAAARPSERLAETQAGIEALKPTKNTRVLLNIGRLSKQKNQAMLIRAYDEIKRDGHDVMLLILGDAHEQADNLKALVKRLGVRDVHFLGVKSNVPDYLACSDFFCLSSLHEGLPITLLEALSVGTVPVCTPVGGIPDVIENGKTGFLAESADQNAYRHSLIQALSTPAETLSRIRKAMKNEFVRHYSIENCARKYLQAYEDALTFPGRCRQEG